MPNDGKTIEPGAIGLEIAVYHEGRKRLVKASLAAQAVTAAKATGALAPLLGFHIARAIASALEDDGAFEVHRVGGGGQVVIASLAPPLRLVRWFYGWRWAPTALAWLVLVASLLPVDARWMVAMALLPFAAAGAIWEVIR